MPIPWDDVKSDPAHEEWLLFYKSVRFGKDRFDRQQKSPSWSERCDKWLLHATVFPYIKTKGGDSSNDEPEKQVIDKGIEFWGDARIAFLNDHLNILDGKINMMLTFNTLFLIAFNVLLNALFSLTPKRTPPQILHFVFDRYQLPALLLTCLTITFAIVWFCITFLCLLAARRIVWGDLGKGLSESTLQSLIDPAGRLTGFNKELDIVETAHVRALIVAIVKRTNKFRIASYLTWVNVFIWIVSLALGFFLLAQHYY